MDPVNKGDYLVTVVSMVLNTTALNLVKRNVEKRSGVVWTLQKKIPKFRILTEAPENKKLEKRV